MADTKTKSPASTTRLKVLFNTQYAAELQKELDLKNPIVTGTFSSKFDIQKLKGLVDEDLMKFTKGRADVGLAFRADVENFKLVRPFVQGKINVKNASVNYVPRNLQFKDINVVLDFADNDLNISKINLKSGKSVIEMEGNIKNFLNFLHSLC